MKLSNYTISLLEDFERRIDPEVEDDLYKQWADFWDDKCDSPVFIPRRKKLTQPGIAIQNVHINDAVTDLELMLDFELNSLVRKLSKPSPALGIRANWGTGIMPSLFGAEVFEMPRNTNTLPTTKPFSDTDEVLSIMENGVPDLRGGWGSKVFDFAEFCLEVFEKYPKVKKYISIYHPDTQGPLDMAELIWGQEMFYEMYDEPEHVHSVLRVLTDTYKAFMDKWYSIIPNGDGLSHHWGAMIKGAILLRLDSAMNLSKDFYEEFSKPYDAELLKYYGGGCMHFCGTGDHYIDSLCEIEDLHGINMTQPHLNDMKKIFAALERNNKKVIGLPDAERYAADIGVRSGIVTGNA